MVYQAVAHPRWLEVLTGAALAMSIIALVMVLFARWRAEGRTLPIAPLVGFLVTVWSWTIYSSIDPLVRYVIPALHSIQYMYFVWLVTRNEARANEGPPTFGKPVAVRIGTLAVSALALGWLLFRGAPTLLDGLLSTPGLASAHSSHVGRASIAARSALPDPLGATPYFAAFFVIVNIHHYFMDHVIWRRENPLTRYLNDGIGPV